MTQEQQQKLAVLQQEYSDALNAAIQLKSKYDLAKSTVVPDKTDIENILIQKFVYIGTTIFDDLTTAWNEFKKCEITLNKLRADLQIIINEITKQQDN